MNIKSFEDDFYSDEMTIIKEKLDIINDLSNELKDIDYSSLKSAESDFHQHPEIFFSLKEIKNIKIHKLLRIGKFGKVILKI